jgi:Bacterial surface protein, Ig-like domain
MHKEKKFNKRKTLLGLIALAVFLGITVGPTVSYALPGLGSVPVAESGAEKLKNLGANICFGNFCLPPLPAPSPTGSWDSWAYFLAQGALKAMSSQIDSYINHSYNGGPAFATDPELFFQENADNVAKAFIQSAQNAANAPGAAPYQSQVNTAVFQNYSDSRLASASTTGDRTPYVANNPLLGTVQSQQAFLNGDFSQGGWDQWYAMTQNGGNPYSATIDAQTQLSTRVQTSQQTQQSLLNWANGFIGKSICIEKDANGNCTNNGPVLTPGSSIEAELNNRLGSTVGTLENVHNWNELLTSLFSFVVDKAIGGGGLFTSSSNPANSGPNSTSNSNGSSYAPTLTLLGNNPLTITVGQAYQEPGYSAVDPNDGLITNKVIVTGTPNTNVIGEYTITYTVTDSSGLTATQTRIVNVVSATSPTSPSSPSNIPIITLIGSSVMNLTVGATFTDPGAIAVDVDGGNISGSIVVSGTVPTNANGVTTTPGSYTLTYNVTDANGLSAATVTRIVNVSQSTSGGGNSGGGSTTGTATQ